MAKFKIALVSFTALLTFALVAPFSVDAQDAPTISSDITDTADAVVEASVVDERAFEVDGTPYTVFEFAVSNTLTGTAADTVHVAVMGGSFADGRELLVSHTAHLEVADVVQAALVSADPAVTASVASALGVADDAVFQVVGGEEGVLILSGSLGNALFAGADDFALHGLAWPSFDDAVEFRVNPSGSPVSTQVTIEAAREAADDWENDPGSAIDFSYEGTTSRTGPNLNDGVNTISFENVTNEGFLARAHWISNRNGHILEFDILVNTRHAFENGSGPGVWWDLPSTLRHEFGHVLGLGHVAADGQVMNSSIFNNTIVPLGDGDLGGVRELYADLTTGFCDGELATVLLSKGQSPTDGRDVIVGTEGDDIIDGLGGNDIICGMEGNDTIRGGDGDDKIWGGNGDDTIHGDDGRDTLIGDQGVDTIHGGELGDKIWGGTGNDRLFGDGGWDSIYGQQGVDTIRGGLGSDKIFGGDGNDRLFGENGPDKIEGNDGDDQIEAGKGRDQVLGGAGNDTINGNRGPDTLSGEDGQDVIHGDRGTDVLFGGASNDELFGDGGWDTLTGGSAFDLCDGGFGQDTSSKCEQTISTP